MKYVLLSFGFFLAQNLTKLIYRTSLTCQKNSHLGVGKFIFSLGQKVVCLLENHEEMIYFLEEKQTIHKNIE